MRAGDIDPSSIDARLAEAAISGETIELILVLRGKVKPPARAGRWRIRTRGQRVLSFSADSVIAATPVAKPQAVGPRQ